MRPLRILQICTLLSAGLTTASGSSILYTAAGTNSASGNAIRASALFDLTGSTLTVTLTNAAPANAFDFKNSDLLVAVFFGSTTLNLTPVSAIAPSLFDPTCAANCDVGIGFQFKNISQTYGAVNGISASGFGVFGPNGNFSPGGINLGGVDYGIVQAGYPGVSSNLHANQGPFINSSVNFTLTVPQGFSLDSIDTLTFQWGTALDEPSLTGNCIDCGGGGGGTVGEEAPEPSTLALLGAGFVALKFVRRRRA